MVRFNFFDKFLNFLRRWGFVISFSGLIAAIASVFAAYRMPSNAPWIATTSFGYDGLYYEILRAILLFTFSFIFFFSSKNSIEGFFVPTSFNFRNKLNLIKLLSVVLYLVFLPILLFYHLSIAPNNSNDPSISAAYVYYLPYSFINYFIYGIPSITLGIYLSYTKIKDIISQRNYLESSMARNSNYEQIDAKMSLFSRKLTTHAQFFSGYIFMLLILLSFEGYFASRSLTTLGVYFTIFGYALFAISLLSLLFFIFMERKKFYDLCDTQVTVAEDSREFQGNYSIPRFLAGIVVSNHYYFIIIISISLIYFPKEIFNYLLKQIGG